VLAQQVCFGRVGPDVFAAMSQPQSWPLSQDANKSSGVCSVCRATRQLHMKDGTVHKHGPRHSPCPGSHKLPLGTSVACPPSTDVIQSLPAAGVGSSASPPSSSAGSSGNPQAATSDQADLIWTPVECSVIKHIPKSARPACATHLAGLLRAVVAQPDVYIAPGWLFSIGVSQYSSLQSVGANATMPHQLSNVKSQGSQLHRSHYTR